METKNNLFIISGVSGVGKNTILNELFKDQSLNLAYSVSMTTRPKRFHEVEGVNYFFADNTRFDEAIANGELLEWAEFCGNRYGTPRKFVEDTIKTGKNVIVEIEVKGAMNMMKMYPEAITIFLLPPSLEELRNRLSARGTESDEIVEKRIEAANGELKFKDYYKHLVINDDLNKALVEIKKIIKRGK